MPENERTVEARGWVRTCVHCGAVDQSDVRTWPVTLCTRPSGHSDVKPYEPPANADPEIWAKCFDGRTCEQPEACHDALRCLRATPKNAEADWPTCPGCNRKVWSPLLHVCPGPERAEPPCRWEHYIGSNETTDEWCVTHSRRLDKCRTATPKNADQEQTDA